jgi:hypothetical protein
MVVLVAQILVQAEEAAPEAVADQVAILTT